MTSRVRLCVSVCALLVSGCGMRLAPGNPERAPEPPPFNEKMLSKDDLHTAMWELAGRTHEINRILRTADATSAADRDLVVKLLDEMLMVSERLGTDSARAGHPVLSRNIDGFRADVRLARNGAAANPPNYFLAGSIAGACANCHGPGYGKVH